MVNGNRLRQGGSHCSVTMRRTTAKETLNERKHLIGAALQLQRVSLLPALQEAWQQAAGILLKKQLKATP